MLETSPSLLERLRTGPDADAWRRLVDLYTPLLHAWLRRCAIQQTDADDLVQEVLSTLVRELPAFRYDPERGAFRSWLRTILVHRLQAFYRTRQAHPQPEGGSDEARHLEQLADPHSDLSRLWNEEHDRHVVHRLLQTIQPDFEPTTWRAFQRASLDGIKPALVAAELGISVNAVFIAKSRALRRLRREMEGLTG
jgi:RNA polymerase sigma-70 factor (ECF subfamily)